MLEFITSLISAEVDSYETLPTSSVTTHMAAGAMAGMMEHVLMYPLDSVKVSIKCFINACFNSNFEFINRLACKHCVQIQMPDIVPSPKPFIK